MQGRQRGTKLGYGRPNGKKGEAEKKMEFRPSGGERKKQEQNQRDLAAALKNPKKIEEDRSRED